jgi:hypothetical protein
MRSDGEPLPNLSETAVLHDLGLIRTDQLPDLAARWLAGDFIDTEAVRMLAGHDTHDPWALEQLLADAVREAHIELPQEPSLIENVVVDYVTAKWRRDGDTRSAVATLARLGETHPDFDLGLFIGLDDEWNGGWGRLAPDLKAAAEMEIDGYLHGH